MSNESVEEKPKEEKPDLLTQVIEKYNKLQDFCEKFTEKHNLLVVEYQNNIKLLDDRTKAGHEMSKILLETYKENTEKIAKLQQKVEQLLSVLES